MRTFYLAAAVTAAIASSPAAAQQGVSPYLGAVLGWDKVHFDEDGFESSDDGVMYGIVTGVDFDFGSAVIGIEAEATETEIGVSATDLYVVGDRAELSAGRDLYLGARLGYNANRSLMIYGKAGYTNARVSLEYEDGADFDVEEGETLHGFRVGGGLELAFTRLIKGRAEYRYSSHGEFDHEILESAVDVSRSQVVFTLLSSF